MQQSRGQGGHVQAKSWLARAYADHRGVVVATVLAGMVCAVWVFIGGLIEASEAAEQEKFVAQSKELAASLPTLLAKTTFRQPAVGLIPAKVWDGADARMLNASGKSFQGGSWRSPPDWTEWTVLARTAGGSYFSVTYVIRKGAECTRFVDCVETENFTPLTERQAREWIYDAGLQHLYKELFHEEMPPREVKA